MDAVQRLGWLERLLEDKDMHEAELRVAIALVMYHNSQTSRCNPSLQTLAGKANITTRSVQRAAQKLEKHGMIRRVFDRGGKNNTNQYDIMGDDTGVVTTGESSPTRHPRRMGDDTHVVSDTTPTSYKQGIEQGTEQGREQGTPQTPLGGASAQTLDLPPETEIPPAKPPKPKKPAKLNGKTAIPPCPHREIIELYHEKLPELRRVKVNLWGGEGEENLRKRWQQSEEHRSLEFWSSFFATVRTNPHWMGGNQRGWKADLRWLLKLSNFTKVVERGCDPASHQHTQAVDYEALSREIAMQDEGVVIDAEYTSEVN